MPGQRGRRDQPCARGRAARTPPLIAIYAHRFITTHEGAEPRAVLSVWQPIDSSFYGNDLADYVANEFHILVTATWSQEVAAGETESLIHTIFEGTSEIQQLVIARAISGLRIE